MVDMGNNRKIPDTCGLCHINSIFGNQWRVSG